MPWIRRHSLMEATSGSVSETDRPKWSNLRSSKRSPVNKFADVCFWSERVFTLIFDVEAVLKIIGFGPKSYFSRRWNRFDFIISLISSISLCLQLIMTSDSNKWLQFLTAFRLLRILKLAQVWPAMNTLLTIIGSALSALGQLTIILGIILYIFAIIGLQLFHDKYNKFQFPNGIPRWNFTDFYHSFMMMFRVLCGEWIEPLMDCMRMKEVPNGLCTLVFFPTLIFGNFVVLNLFLALLLNSFGENTINSADTREAKRLREAKQRFKAKFKWLIHIFNPEREIRLIIHRPSHRDSIIHRPELNEAISAQRLNDSTLGSNHDGSCTTESSKLNPSTTSVERSPAVSGNASSIYVSIKETRTRKGTVVSSDIKVKPVTPPEDGTDDTDKDGPSPCLPKFILKRMSSLRDRFNNSKCGKKWTALRNAVLERVLTDFFEYIVMFVIILSSVMLAFEDFNFQQTKHSLLKDIVKYANYAFAVLFTLEMIIRWMAYGVTRYFTSAWNIIDFIVVVVSVMGVISVEDEGGKTSGFADFTAFRALRAFRPLRVISRIEGMKIVVNSLMRAIPAILNVFVVSMLFWLIFCVMGVQFFRGKFYKCIYKHSQNRVQSVRTRPECEKNPNWYWYNSNINFDNAASGFLALFQVATFEGWMEIMHDAVDATEVDVQPRFEASPYSYLYFVAFIICGSFFSLNLVIGVIIDNFNVLKKKYEGSYLDGFLTTTQRNYYNTLKKMSTRKPKKIIPPPRTRFQMVFYNLAVSDRFELVLMSVVMLNMIVLGVEYSQYKLTCVWYEVLWVLDVGFCVFFIIEAIMKLVGLRKYYFTLPWNCYDFTVAILTTFDVTVHLIHQYRGLKWPLRVHSDAEYAITDGGIFVMPPIFLRLIRIFRISRVLRIIKVAKGLRKVIFSLVISLPAIINIMALLMLCLYIYAIFGMFLFSNIKINGALTPMMNFRSFKGAALLLLSLSTAAGWNDVLEPLLLAPPFCNKTHFRFDDGHVKEMKGGDCGNQTMAVPYMVSYIILTSLFIINLYIAVILENYNQAHQQDEVGVTEDDFDMFYSVWQRYDPNASQYIPYTQLSNFVADLDPPLGIPKPNEIALVSINLPILQGDRIHCLDILLGLVRNVLPEIDESDELQSMKQQINTRFMARFPLRTKMTQISCTIYRKKQDVAARTLQRAWQVFKTQQAIQSIMKITVKASHRRGSLVGRNPSSVEELTNNMSLAYARYFQKLLKGSGNKEPRGTQFSLRLPKTHAGASDLPS
ncbi:sodium channel protein 1 brain-like [Babylonia areolata]|uniref:sodium channel protein 1 brain-like n=1 Tax=Babylonia areolata TaxID=304850 RepID=UPI003FCF2C75